MGWSKVRQLNAGGLFYFMHQSGMNLNNARARSKSPRDAKSALVFDAIQRRPGKFSVTDLQKRMSI
jgi:hypothetical protein